jgi:Trypsin-like peptidase domain
MHSFLKHQGQKSPTRFHEDPKKEHGTAFLIEATISGYSGSRHFVSPLYYLTARHVVEPAISNLNLPIRGLDIDQREISLKVIAEDRTLDIALLKSDNKLDGVFPYEIFLKQMRPQRVTFAGLAYATSEKVVTTPPAEADFADDPDGTLLVTMNTNGGDSGALLYNRQGLVIGMVIKKKSVSQATAVSLAAISDFLRPLADSLPAGEQLGDFIVGTSDRRSLISRLNPAHLPDRVSNLQLLGAIRRIVNTTDWSIINDNIDCPIIRAAHDRALEDAAADLERERLVRRVNQNPLPQPERTVPASQRRCAAGLTMTIS